MQSVLPRCLPGVRLCFSSTPQGCNGGEGTEGGLDEGGELRREKIVVSQGQGCGLRRVWTGVVCSQVYVKWHLYGVSLLNKQKKPARCGGADPWSLLVKETEVDWKFEASLDH